MALRVRSLVLLAALLAAGLAACTAPVPVPPDVPFVCLDQPPASAADYQRAFSVRGPWAGGDGAIDVALPDGRVLWIFGDTFVDGLAPDGAALHPFVHNSIVVQSGACFTMVSAGLPGARGPILPPSAPGTWLWPSGAVVDPVAGFLRIVALRVTAAPGPPGWNWRVEGIDVVSLHLPDLAWGGTVAAPIPQGGRVHMGGGALTVGADVYLYGTVDGRQVVARTTPATIATEPWLFWSPALWTANPFAAAALDLPSPPRAQPTVIAHDGGYLLSAKSADVLSDDVVAWWGPTPAGPFRRLGRVATTTVPDGWFTYAGRVASLPGAGLVVVWSRNAAPRITDMRHYGPVFARPAPAVL